MDNKEIIEELITYETRFHNLETDALISYLAEKGVIDFKEAREYIDNFSHSIIQNRYPQLFQDD